MRVYQIVVLLKEAARSVFYGSAVNDYLDGSHSLTFLGDALKNFTHLISGASYDEVKAFTESFTDL